MMFKFSFKKYLGIFICSFIFFMVGTVNECEASMHRTMSWSKESAYIVTISNFEEGYNNMCKLNTYSKSDQQGLTLDIVGGTKTDFIAITSSSNSSNKSAYAEHYTYSGSTIYRKKIYYRNKGEGYDYD